LGKSKKSKSRKSEKSGLLKLTLKGGLPGWSDDELLLELVPDTVILGKGREGEEVAHEEHVVRLHDDGAGHLNEAFKVSRVLGASLSLAVPV
jgi:hypothetical protein